MCTRTHLVIFKCCTFRTQTPMRTVGDWTGTKLQALVDDVLPSRKVPESDARSVGGCSYKYHFCRDKHVFVTTNICLPWQNFCSDYIMLVVTKYFCHDKMFVVTNICHDKHVFVATFFLLRHYFFWSRQAYFSHDNTFYWNKHIICKDFCDDKTHVLQRQTCICHDKCFVTTKLCLSWQIFVVTKVLSWQKCRILVATKDKHMSWQKW